MDRRPFAEEYPFADHYLTIDAVRYHYIDEGAGDPVLMIHGNPTWSFYYRRLIRAFSNTRRCIAVDHVGCGLSDKPIQYDYSLSRHVENLKRLIAELDLQRVTLVVHDWGGAIGMGAFADQPERVERLIVLNTAAFRSQEIPLRIAVCRIPIFGALAVRGLNGFARAAIHMATSKPERMTPAVRAGYLAPYHDWASRVAVHRFVMDIPLKPSHPSYKTLQSIEESLPRFADKPMLLAWGMDDWCFTPRFLDRWIEFFPHARVERLESAGHYVLEDAHEQIIPLARDFMESGRH